MTSYLSDDRHSAGIASVILGVLFLTIGLILLLVKDAKNVKIPMWRHITSLFIVSIGGISIVTGIVFASLPSSTSPASIVPILDIETIRSDPLTFSMTDRSIQEELEAEEANMIDDSEEVEEETEDEEADEEDEKETTVKIENKLLTLSNNDTSTIFVTLPKALSSYTFIDAAVINNVLFSLVKSNVNSQLLRYIIKSEDNLVVLRERFAVQDVNTKDYDNEHQQEKGLDEDQLHITKTKNAVSITIQNAETVRSFSKFTWHRKRKSTRKTKQNEAKTVTAWNNEPEENKEVIYV